MITVQMVKQWKADPGIPLGRIPGDLVSALQIGIAGCEKIQWEMLMARQDGCFLLVSNPVKGSFRLLAEVTPADTQAGKPIIKLFGKLVTMMPVAGGLAILRRISGQDIMKTTEQ